MRTVRAALGLVIGMTLTTACTAASDDSEASSQGMTEADRSKAEKNFHPKATCFPYQSEWSFGELYSPPIST